MFLPGLTEVSEKGWTSAPSAPYLQGMDVLRLPTRPDLTQVRWFRSRQGGAQIERRPPQAVLRLYRRLLTLLLGLVAIWALALATPLHAQSGGSAASPSVLVINMERLLRDTDAARSIQRQAAALRGEIQMDLATRQDALRAEEQELVVLRAELAASAFAERVSAFEEKVRALKRESSARGSLLQRALFEATEELKRRLRPELIRIMEERRAAVLLDAADIVVSDRNLDVTDEAIARFNASTPEIAVSWPSDAVVGETE